MKKSDSNIRKYCWTTECLDKQADNQTRTQPRTRIRMAQAQFRVRANQSRYCIVRRLLVITEIRSTIFSQHTCSSSNSTHCARGYGYSSHNAMRDEDVRAITHAHAPRTRTSLIFSLQIQTTCGLRCRFSQVFAVGSKTSSWLFPPHLVLANFADLLNGTCLTPSSLRTSELHITVQMWNVCRTHSLCNLAVARATQGFTSPLFPAVFEILFIQTAVP